jgi:membrane protein DedA with SNARE-associated domain
MLGYLVLKGELEFVPTFATTLAGVLSGITCSYILGRSGGMFVIRKYGSFLHVTEARLLLVHQWFDRTGKWSLTIGYFLPGLRHALAIIAGASGLKLSSFMLYAYSGAVIWTTVFITTGYIIGKAWRQWSETMHGFLLMAFVAIMLMSAGYLIYRRWFDIERRR